MSGTPRGRTVRPAAGPLRAELSVPGDKSVGHRALLIGALCEGTLRIRGLSDGEDVRSSRRCLEALGADIRDEDGAVVVRGRPLRAPSGPLDCGNSGTTMRLLMGILAGHPFESVLTGDASLSKRPMRRVADPLREMGAQIALSEAGTAPVTVRGRRPLKALRRRLEVPSAQVKSAILLAGLWSDGETVVEDPFGCRDHTERMLAWLGGAGRLRSDRELVVPGDPSSAAFFLAAAALVPGSRVTVRGVLLNPTRLGFVEALRAMGAKVTAVPRGESGGEPVGDLVAEHAPLKAFRLDPARVPALVDEVPLLAVVAAAAAGTTRLEGLAELRHKESDRLAGTSAALDAVGGRARVEGDALVIEGGARLKGGSVETLGDHRLAMAFSVAALAAEGEVRLSDADCAAISYPGFYDALEGLRG